MTNHHDTDTDGLAPQSIEAEQSVLGALLRFNDGFDQVGDLDAKHFVREDHRLIYAEIARMIGRGEPADVMTVYANLEGRGGAIDASILPYLHRLTETTPSAAHIGRYAGIVVDRALRRAVLFVADSISGLAMNPKGKTADEVVDKMQSLVTSLAERRVRNEPKMLREVLATFIDGISRRAEGMETAIPTGIAGIDRLLTGGGLRPGQLVIVAGRPSMGKSALTSDIGLNISATHSVLTFSMEMESQEVAGRALANRGRVDLGKVMGTIAADDSMAWDGVTASIIKCDDLRFGLDETPALTLLELRMKAKAWKRKHGLDVIIVDYLGLMTGGDGDKRSDEIGSYSRGLKALAKELGVAVIALAQLNRKVEERTDPRPMLSDLRDSGEIEQDADIVMFIHRPEMRDPENPEVKGYAEVLVRKQRAGSLGDISLRFDGATCAFSGWTGRPPTAPAGKGRSSRFDG